MCYDLAIHGIMLTESIMGKVIAEMMKENAHKKYFEELQGDFSVSYLESEKSPLNRLHVHEAFEITLILSDNASVEVNEEEYDLQKGSLLFFNTMDLHRIRAGEDSVYRRFVLWFKYDFLMELEPIREELLKCFYNRAFEKANLVQLEETQLQEVLELYKRMEMAHKGQKEDFPKDNRVQNQAAKLMVKLLLGEFLLTVNGIYQKQHTGADAPVSNDLQAVYKVIRYIQEHLADKLDRFELARMAGMDIRRLNDHFRVVTGMPVGQYILNCRLTVAKAYLAQGLPVMLVCEKAGFGDCCNFSRTFRKHVGVSPKQYATRLTADVRAKEGSQAYWYGNSNSE